MAVTPEHTYSPKAETMRVVKYASIGRSFVLAVMLAFLQTGATYAKTLEEVVRAHESGLNSIHSIDLHLLIERTPKSDRSASPEKVNDIHWLADRLDGRTRLQRQDLTLPNFSRGRFIDAVTTANGDYRVLRGWDPDQPADVGPGVQMRALGEEGPSDPKRPAGGMDVSANLLWLVDSAPPATLAEAVAERPGSELLPDKQEVDGAQCFVITMPHSDTELGWKMSVFVDANLNFAIRKIESVTKPFVVEGRKEPAVVSVKATAKEHRSVGDGIFIPTEVEVIRSDNGYVYTTRVSSVKVNQPFDANAFELVIPKGVRIQDTTTNTVGLANGEGGRIVTWANREEEEEWLLNNYGPSAGPTNDNSASSWWFWVATIGAIVLIFVVSVILRRQQRNQ